MTASLSVEVFIDIAMRPHENLVSLVEATTFGSDGLQYRRLNVQYQIEQFCNPVFFHALHKGELIGVYILDKRELLIRRLSVNAYYRGVLAVDVNYQGMGVGRKLAQSAAEWMAVKAKSQPVLSYGCIDQSNRRSLHLLRSVGGTIGASLSMYMMYRQWPADICELEALRDNHAPAVHTLAQEVYADCEVRDVSASSLPGLVLEDREGLAICARLRVSGFQITAMGTMAALGTRIFVKPFAPARKRFDPDCFRYVSFSEVLIRPGCERLWPRFVSTVLARHECHFGALYVDPGSRLFTRLQQAQGLTRLLHSSRGSIDVVWQSFKSADKHCISLPAPTESVQLWPVDA
ncbi:MAG: GNAT family N-acetyltransferase [Granulosicoccus sp.]